MIRRSVLGAALACALPLVACSATTFGGLGDDDDGGFGVDSTTSGGDAIFPTDDAASTDTAKADTSISTDTAVSADTAVPDTAAPSDTLVADTAVPDTAVPDTDVPDTLAPDTAVADTAVPDTAVADTLPPPDTAPPPWTDVVGKVSCYDTESSPPHAVQCDKDCCGNLDFVLSWHWKCGDGCGFGSRTYSCDQSADCSGGVCCTGTNGFGTVNGSSCRTGTNCGGDKQLCATSAECGGKTCKAYNPPDTKFTVGACE
jgi:hypothetical protein